MTRVALIGYTKDGDLSLLGYIYFIRDMLNIGIELDARYLKDANHLVDNGYIKRTSNGRYKVTASGRAIGKNEY